MSEKQTLNNAKTSKAERTQMKQKVTNTTNKKILHKQLSYKLMDAVFQVRNTYGSGQKELVYQNALSEILNNKEIPHKQEVRINIISEKSGKILGNYRLDFVVDGKICVETKAIKFTPKKIEQQLYSYLKSTPYEIGYLINYGSTNFYWKRVILTNDRKKLFKKISFNS